MCPVLKALLLRKPVIITVLLLSLPQESAIILLLAMWQQLVAEVPDILKGNKSMVVLTMASLVSILRMRALKKGNQNVKWLCFLINTQKNMHFKR